MSIAQAGVYLPFKSLLQGSGIVLTETATSITVGTTGAGPGGGDMLKSEYATNGVNGVVDKAVVAEGLTSGANVPYATQAGSVPWGGITGAPTTFPSSWSQITGIPATFPSTWSTVSGKPTTFPPSPHETTHLPGGTDVIPMASRTSAGLLAQLSGAATDYVGGDNATHQLPNASNPDGDLIPPASPSAFDDEFKSATLNPKWTISGAKALVTATLTGSDYLQLAYQYGATGSIVLRATEPLTGIAAGFGFQIKLRGVLNSYGSGGASTNYLGNVAFGLLTSSRSIGVGLSVQTETDGSGTQLWYIMFGIWKGSGMGNLFYETPAMYTGTDLRFKIWNDTSGGTPGQLSIAVSTDAINWLTIYTEAFSNGGSLNGTFPTSLVLDVDSGGATGGGGAAMGAFDYVRKIS
jgi:hypothetical protein